MGELRDVLIAARKWGFLGPGPVSDHIAHAGKFALAAVRVGELAPTHVVDLGSGGGVPGLVLALRWPAAEFLLVDVNERRAAFLEDAVRALGLSERVAVARVRAEDFGRENRQVAELVVARGFGPPAVTAECAAPLLRVGGRLVVSEPPEHVPARWSTSGLEQLGLGPVRSVLAGGARFAVLAQGGACPTRYPRRVGVPAKRPLW